MRKRGSISMSFASGELVPYEDVRVALNVGGSKFETFWQTLERHPDTRLGKLRQLCSTFKISQNSSTQTDLRPKDPPEFFFDRQPKSFNSILDFYRTGRLHLVDEMCPIAFGEDLEFWGISESSLDSCCLQKYQKHKDVINEGMIRETQLLPIEEEAEFGNAKCLNTRTFLWNLFEKPSSSFAAKWISIISIFFILLSIVAFLMGTIPGFQDCSYQFLNSSICLAYPNSGWFQATNDTRPLGLSNDVIWVPSKYLQIIEAVSIGWFTLEYLIRFIASPNKWNFLKGGMNNVDLLVILPYYIGLIIEATVGAGSKKMHKFLQVLRVLRIVRVFKLVRYSSGLQSVGYTMKKSYKELLLLLLFLGMGILVFSSLAFYAESGQNESFSSIPACFWWAVITMTTVGYGDMYPVTLPGKIIGGMCAVSGILVVAFPIPIIVNNFGEFYRKQKIRQKVLKKRQGMMKKNPSLSSGMSRQSSTEPVIENQFLGKK